MTASAILALLAAGDGAITLSLPPSAFPEPPPLGDYNTPAVREWDGRMGVDIGVPNRASTWLAMLSELEGFPGEWTVVYPEIVHLGYTVKDIETRRQDFALSLARVCDHLRRESFAWTIVGGFPRNDYEEAAYAAALSPTERSKE